MHNIDSEIFKIRKTFMGNSGVKKITLERRTGSWGNKTASGNASHTSGASIFICKHSTLTEEMGMLNTTSLPTSEHQIPLRPLVIKGDTRTKQMTDQAGVFLKKLTIANA